MTNRHLFTAVSLLTVLSTGAAHGFSHVSNYETNLMNYRVCKDDPLRTCSWEDTRSPSKFYLQNSTKGSLQYGSNGTVKLRIDDIRLDDNTTFACEQSTSTCQVGVCVGPPYDGNPCLNDGSCQAPVCVGGPRRGRLCGGSEPSCTNMDGSSGWTVIFRGNQTSYETTAPFEYSLRGDDAAGCMKVCSFTLANDGSPSVGGVNSDGLTCSQTGDCAAFGPERPFVFHVVEVRDPDGSILAVPGIGSAGWIGYPVAEGDPAKVGDACRSVSPPPDCE